MTVTYNQLDSLKKLYKSILEQKEYLNEWVVYDDSSTDGTSEWLDEPKEIKTKVIHGVKREKPLVVANMNACFKEVDDNPFILVFADTYLGKDALKNLSETYVPNSFGSAYRNNVDKDNNFISGDCYFTEAEGVINVMRTSKPWLNFAGNGMVATKKIMESIGGIDEHYGGYGTDDYDTACRAFMNGALLYRYNNVKVYHLDHPAKNSTPDNIERFSKKIVGDGYLYNGKTLTLDFDDFSVENNNLYYLDQLKRIYPKMKVSMFYVPFDAVYFNRIMDFQRQEGIKAIKDRLDWIELIPHGLTHTVNGRDGSEFNYIKNDNYESIFAGIEEAFKTYGLPMVKGFKAPHWAYKQSLVDYLDSKGWWLAVDRNQPESPRTKKHYVYTHSIDEPFWLSNQDSIRLHGHISLPSKNNIVDNLTNLLKINPDVEWKFISEII